MEKELDKCAVEAGQDVGAATKTKDVPKVYESLGAVMREISVIGKNLVVDMKSHKYNARGIQPVIDSLHVLMAKHNLILESCFDKLQPSDLQQFPIGANKSIQMQARVVGRFTAVSTIDGSSALLAQMPGEALDYGDKATAKALSQSLKYALGFAFLIPFAEIEDQDKTRPELEGQPGDSSISPFDSNISPFNARLDSLHEAYRAAGKIMDPEKICKFFNVKSVDDLTHKQVMQLLAQIKALPPKKEVQP